MRNEKTDQETLSQHYILRSIRKSESGCWIWQKSCNSSGYGQLTVNKKYWTAHRYAYTAFIGKIPDGMIIRHLCHNTMCCNPRHLKVGTQAENYKDSLKEYRRVATQLRARWIIGGKSFRTCREASQKTGITQATLCKYMIGDIFDVEAYRDGCRIANCKPRI